MIQRGSWFPVIYAERCNGCVGLDKPRCIHYCPNGVFNLEDDLAVVANPQNCIYLCSSCEPVCPRKAIAFPQRTATPEKTKSKREELIRKTKCDVCGKIYWTNRETDVCLDCERKER